jgi:hypothetical protein
LRIRSISASRINDGKETQNTLSILRFAGRTNPNDNSNTDGVELATMNPGLTVITEEHIGSQAIISEHEILA